MKIAYLGSKPLGLSILKALHEATPQAIWRVIHPDDSSDHRTCVDAFQAFAREQSLDMLIAASPSAATQMLRDFKPDVVFVCGWYWLIKPEFLNLARLGFWGVHNSLLPLYRGASPLVWSIINGDPVVGSTAFRFTPGMDDGPILHQVRVPLAETDTIKEALANIEAELLRTLPEKWKALIQGRAPLVMQDEAKAAYCGQRIPEDGLIDWSRPASDVYNFIRAQSDPYPGAFTLVGGQRVSIQQAQICPERWDGTRGQVLQRSKTSVLIACGASTALRVNAVTVDGESCPPSKAFNSISLRLQ